MRCRNCGRADLPLHDVTLDGERAVEVVLCVRCLREYEDIGWVTARSPHGAGPADEDDG